MNGRYDNQRNDGRRTSRSSYGQNQPTVRHNDTSRFDRNSRSGQYRDYSRYSARPSSVTSYQTRQARGTAPTSRVAIVVCAVLIVAALLFLIINYAVNSSTATTYAQTQQSITEAQSQLEELQASNEQLEAQRAAIEETLNTYNDLKN